MWSGETLEARQQNTNTRHLVLTTLIPRLVEKELWPEVTEPENISVRGEISEWGGTGKQS